MRQVKQHRWGVNLYCGSQRSGARGVLPAKCGQPFAGPGLVKTVLPRRDHLSTRKESNSFVTTFQTVGDLAELF